MNEFILGENATRQMTLMQLQGKLKKTAKITYLEVNQQEARYRLS